jgi:4-oxalocrotonate tautomerase
MPVIKIDCNKLTQEQKRELIKSVTEVSSRIMQLPESTITIILREVDADDVGVGGKLLCDIH